MNERTYTALFLCTGNSARSQMAEALLNVMSKGRIRAYSADAGFNGSHQGHLMDKLAVRDGAVAIVNSSLAAGRGSRVWLMRGKLSR